MESSDFPQFYRPDRVGELFPADTATAIQAGEALGLPPGSSDAPRVVLLLVDAQVDFVHPDGALSVPHAVEDTRRTVEWVLRNVRQLSQIAASLDSHLPNQIFYSTWWTDSEGNSPDAMTVITGEEVESGEWRPLFEPEWSRGYVRALEQQAKKQLMIWPFHAMIGTAGHLLVPALSEAIAYHAAARRARPNFITKGTIAKSEYYSLIEPEIQVPGDPAGVPNLALLDWLMDFDLIYVAGQAKSHCVLESLNSIVRYHGDQRHHLEKVRVLMDCTSSVQHPDIDFEAMAEEAYQDFAKRGMQLVTASDPIG